MRLYSPHDREVVLPTLGVTVPARGQVRAVGSAAASLEAQGWTRTKPAPAPAGRPKSEED